MLPGELLRQIRKLEIRTNRAVDEIIGGAWHSVFKGRGIEFDEVREYFEGDDVRDIDWNVTARCGKPYVKKYAEERELSVLLAVDISASENSASNGKSKRMLGVESAAMLAMSAVRNHDKVGLLLFSDRLELYLPPRSGRRHVLRLIRELLAFEPTSRGTDIDQALREIRRILNKRSVVFVLSDLMDETHDFETALKLANRRHDVVALRITDPIEHEAPLLVGGVFSDAETGETAVATGSAAMAEAYRKSAEALATRNRECCRRAGVDLVDLQTGTDPLPQLLEFFGRRRKRAASRG